MRTTNREINKFFQSLNFGYGKSNIIAHLHGSFRHPPSIVLCLEDYEKRYGQLAGSQNWPLHKRIIWALMATRRLVYLGFSMSDPFFRMMHGIVSKDFGTFGSETHYVISRYSTDDPKEAGEQLKFAEKLKEHHGIQVIFYDDDKSYEGLKEFLHQLSRDVTSRSSEEKSVKEEIKIPKTVPAVQTDKELAERLKSISRLKNKKIREG
jgi:hypothetical protein